MHDHADARRRITSWVSRTWSRIEDWMRSNAPEALGVLRHGLPEKTVRETEQSLALKLPDSFRRSIGQHDGQEWAGWPTLIEAGILMPLEEMVVRSRENERHGVDEAGRDGEAWWRRGWFPFVSRDGDYLSLALGSSGEGEVWCFLHDMEPMHSLVAPDFTTWLERWADELEAGVFELDHAPGAGLFPAPGRRRGSGHLTEGEARSCFRLEPSSASSSRDSAIAGPSAGHETAALTALLDAGAVPQPNVRRDPRRRPWMESKPTSGSAATLRRSRGA